MPFVDVKLKDVELEKPQAIPVGDYVFQLLPGAEVRINKYSQLEELNLSASVAEGDFQGRRVFWSYPDPSTVGTSGNSFAWSSQAMKKLEISLGEDALDGEDSLSYFNRVAGNMPRFRAKMVTETRKNKETSKYEPYIREGETEPRAVFGIFTVGASA